MKQTEGTQVILGEIFDQSDMPAPMRPALFKSNYNGVQTPLDLRYEHPSNISETVPDQSLTMREILQRHSSGMPLSGGRTPVYNGEDDIPQDLLKMDLADRESYLDSLRERNKIAYDEIRRKQKIHADKIEAEKNKKTEPDKGEESTNTL